jgi:biopolymer transport protein ExbD
MMFNKKTRRDKQSVNAGSMADIAFLLLIFFLVTTTIVQDQGITVKLPPWEEDPVKLSINENNVLSVYINVKNELLVEGDRTAVNQLRAITQLFIANPLNDPKKPASPKKAVVSIICDRGTSYATFLAVYNELKAAYRELWDAAAQDNFGKRYSEITLEQQKSIREEIPLVISEAEPVDFRGAGF